MSSSEEREYEIDRLERKLKEQEEQLRLRQIESEIDRQNQVKYYPTRKYNPEQEQKPTKPLRQKFVLGLKLFGLGVIALVAVRVASALASLLIICALGFAVYQLFLKKRD